jgi:hypothetical protein
MRGIWVKRGPRNRSRRPPAARSVAAYARIGRDAFARHTGPRVQGARGAAADAQRREVFAPRRGGRCRGLRSLCCIAVSGRRDDARTHRCGGRHHRGRFIHPLRRRLRLRSHCLLFRIEDAHIVCRCVRSAVRHHSGWRAEVSASLLPQLGSLRLARFGQHARLADSSIESHRFSPRAASTLASSAITPRVPANGAHALPRGLLGVRLAVGQPFRASLLPRPQPSIP